MTTTTVTLTGDVSDAIGNDFDTRRTKAYVKHNTDKIVTDAGPIHLGGGTVNVEADGTFTLPNVVASTSLVENLQATVYVDYADPATRQRATATFGPYDLSAETGTVDIRTLESVQALPASAISTATALLDTKVAAAAASATAADASADAAAASAAEATAIVIADADAAMAAAINTPGSDTATALTASTAAQIARERPFDTADLDNPTGQGKNLGIVLYMDPTPGTFDHGYVEGPGAMFKDPETGKIGCSYVAYDKVTTDPTAKASIGLRWQAADGTFPAPGIQIARGTGVVGDPDKSGLTGARIVFDENGALHMFPIALPADGYEALDAEKTIVHLTAPSLSAVVANPDAWTRHGVVIAPSHVAGRIDEDFVWKIGLIRVRGRWVGMYNASGDGKERCAVADFGNSLNNTPTVLTTTTPAIPDAGHETDFIWGGDPHPFFDGPGIIRVHFSNHDGTGPDPVGDWEMWTTEEEFLDGLETGVFGWRDPIQVTDYMAGEPWKSSVYRLNGQVVTIGTALGAIAMMVQNDVTNAPRTVDQPWRFAPPITASGAASVYVGKKLTPAVGAFTKVMLGSDPDNNTSAGTMYGQGESDTRMTYWGWVVHPDPTQSYATLGSYGGGNPLKMEMPLHTAAVAAARAGFRLPHGTAPSAPVDGDMWTTTAGLFVRINGVTKTVTLT